MFNGEYKVGEIFQCGLIKLKVVEAESPKSCYSCDLEVLTGCYGQLYNLVGLCNERKDNKHVVFKLVEENNDKNKE